MDDSRWVPTDFTKDEFGILSRMVVDFARSVGLREAQDDDLLVLVIAAYRAGKESVKLPERGWIS